MKKLLALAFVMLFAVVVGTAADKKDVTLNGYIIDNACASAHANDADVAQKIASHPKSCAMMEKCLASGHQLFADGKLYKFDSASDKKVVDVVKNSKSDKGLQVMVQGTLDGDTIHVVKISETTAS